MRPHVAADAAAASAHHAAVERLDGEIVGKAVNRQCAAVMADEAGAIDPQFGHAVPAGVSNGGRLAIAPFHSITSSARPRSGSGTVMPSAFAVLRLMIS